MATQQDGRAVSLLILINHAQHDIICITELDKMSKLACTQRKRLYWVISSQFISNHIIFSKPLRYVNFTMNLTQAREFIGKFYHLFHGYSNKKLKFTTYQHCPKIAIRRRRKGVNLPPKQFVFFLYRETTFPNTFASSDLKCLPHTIPEFFAQTQVSDQRQLNNWIHEQTTRFLYTT